MRGFAMNGRPARRGGAALWSALFLAIAAWAPTVWSNSAAAVDIGVNVRFAKVNGDERFDPLAVFDSLGRPDLFLCTQHQGEPWKCSPRSITDPELTVLAARLPCKNKLSCLFAGVPVREGVSFDFQLRDADVSRNEIVEKGRCTLQGSALSCDVEIGNASLELVTNRQSYRNSITEEESGEAAQPVQATAAPLTAPRATLAKRASTEAASSEADAAAEVEAASDGGTTETTETVAATIETPAPNADAAVEAIKSAAAAALAEADKEAAAQPAPTSAEATAPAEDAAETASTETATSDVAASEVATSEAEEASIPGPERAEAPRLSPRTLAAIAAREANEKAAEAQRAAQAAALEAATTAEPPAAPTEPETVAAEPVEEGRPCRDGR